MKTKKKPFKGTTKQLNSDSWELLKFTRSETIRDQYHRVEDNRDAVIGSDSVKVVKHYVQALMFLCGIFGAHWSLTNPH